MQQKMSVSVANADRGAALMLMMVVEPSCAGFQESGTRKADESGEMKFRAFASGRTATKSKGRRSYLRRASDEDTVRATLALTAPQQFHSRQRLRRDRGCEYLPQV